MTVVVIAIVALLLGWGLYSVIRVFMDAINSSMDIENPELLHEAETLVRSAPAEDKITPVIIRDGDIA